MKAVNHTLFREVIELEFQPVSGKAVFPSHFWVVYDDESSQKADGGNRGHTRVTFYEQVLPGGIKM
jgi:hypothetical protein